MERISYWQYELKMSNEFKDADIKKRLYYFFDDVINIKKFDPNKIEIDEKSYKILLFTKLDMW